MFYNKSDIEMKIHCNTGVDIAQYGTTGTSNMQSITISKNKNR